MMQCVNCGTQVPAGQRNCAKCGSSTENPYALSAAVATQTAGPVNTAHPYAGFWRRAFAYLIDYFVVALAGRLISLALFSGLTAAGAPLYLLLLFVVASLYYASMESSGWQATLGKRALGIKVTDLYGERIGFGRALGRVLAHVPSGIILGIGFVMTVFTSRRQTLHDMIAGTLVVKRAETPEEIAQAGPAAPVPAWVAVLVVLASVLFGPFGLGIFSAITIPAYQEYTIRAQIVEGLNAAVPFKAAVESALARGVPLDSIDSAALDMSLPDSAKYLESVRVRHGIIYIGYGRSISNKLTGGHLVLVPGLTGGARLAWVCGHAEPPPNVTLVLTDYQRFTNIPDKWLPLACRRKS
jgi:uncharacterized RDD family membrane protein YckC